MAERRLIWLGGAALLLAGLFLFWQLRGPVGFILSLRGVKLAALILVGAAGGVSTVLFQTVIGNRLLTPGIVGFDSLYIFLQTTLVMGLGGFAYTQLPALGLLLDIALMAGVTILLFWVLLRHGAQDLTKMVLTGVILGILLRGLAEFAQRLLDPSEFSIVQQVSFARFGSVDQGQLLLSGMLLLAVMLLAMRMAAALDVVALGRPMARSLGLGYDRLVLLVLAMIAVLVSVSTALAGPLSFLGLLAASLAREVIPQHRHRLLLPAAALVGAGIMIGGQFVFERLLGQQSTIGVVVEFLGGLLFILLVIRRGRG